MPNDRQLAVVIWLAVALVFVLRNCGLRRSIRSLVRAFLAPKVLTAFVVMSFWVCGEVVFAETHSLWNLRLTTGTVFWFAGSGLVLFVNLAKTYEEPHFFRTSIIKVAKLSVFLGFFMNLFVLDLPAELILQPALFFLFLTSAFAAHQAKFREAKRVLDSVIWMITVSLGVYETAELALRWSSLSKVNLVAEFVLPAWLTLGLLPFIYLLGIFAAYGNAFFRTELLNGRNWGRRLALVSCFGPRANRLNAFVRGSTFRLSNAESFLQARSTIRNAGPTDQ